LEQGNEGQCLELDLGGEIWSSTLTTTQRPKAEAIYSPGSPPLPRRAAEPSAEKGRFTGEAEQDLETSREERSEGKELASFII
jgi:hypothetical protein